MYKIQVAVHVAPQVHPEANHWDRIMLWASNFSGDRCETWPTNLTMATAYTYRSEMFPLAIDYRGHGSIICPFKSMNESMQ